jgi:ATP-dependent Zn protease
MGCALQEYSDALARVVDDEARSLVNKALETTRSLLKQHRDGLEQVRTERIALPVTMSSLHIRHLILPLHVWLTSSKGMKIGSGNK